jgi:hypothetical protein
VSFVVCASEEVAVTTIAACPAHLLLQVWGHLPRHLWSRYVRSPLPPRLRSRRSRECRYVASYLFCRGLIAYHSTSGPTVKITSSTFCCTIRNRDLERFPGFCFQEPSVCTYEEGLFKRRRKSSKSMSHMHIAYALHSKFAAIEERTTSGVLTLSLKYVRRFRMWWFLTARKGWHRPWDATSLMQCSSTAQGICTST